MRGAGAGAATGWRSLNLDVGTVPVFRTFGASKCDNLISMGVLS